MSRSLAWSIQFGKLKFNGLQKFCFPFKFVAFQADTNACRDASDKLEYVKIPYHIKYYPLRLVFTFPLYFLEFNTIFL